MSNGNDNRPGQDRRDSDIGEAVSRLEKAVSELVTVAKDQTVDKAARFIEDTSKRIEAELRFSRVSSEEADEARERRRRRRRHRHERARRSYSAPAARTKGLYRDPTDEKIGGVCSGIARYFGLETWVVRLSALTGLIFIPGVVFPAYWIAYFVMDAPPSSSSDSPQPDQPRGRRKRSERSSRKKGRAAEPEPQVENLPEPVSPRRSLRNSEADFEQIELRLRRMESFVTSGEYELHKELAKIDNDGEQGHAR